jgi:hypothetical protein
MIDAAFSWLGRMLLLRVIFITYPWDLSGWQISIMFRCGTKVIRLSYYLLAFHLLFLEVHHLILVLQRSAFHLV